MFEIRQTELFAEWLNGLSDPRAAHRIAQRIVCLQSGLFGDVKPVGQGISELRIDHGPGYRIYFVQRGRGGDKKTQTRDIKKAKALAADLED